MPSRTGTMRLESTTTASYCAVVCPPVVAGFDRPARMTVSRAAERVGMRCYSRVAGLREGVAAEATRCCCDRQTTSPQIATTLTFSDRGAPVQLDTDNRQD